jgi:hypothetical protein
MRLIIRFLLRASEFGAALFGVFLVFILVNALFPVGSPQAENGVAPLTACFGWTLTVVGLVLFRRRTRTWKINYDATCWQLSKAERALHPARARVRRLAGRTVIYLPSGLAALVLFFFPVVTHMAHPSSQHLRRYRIPIPWNFAVFQSEFPEGKGWVHVVVNTSVKGRFGMTPFPVPPIWEPGPVSWADFGYNPGAAALDSRLTAMIMKEATEVRTREFRLDGIVLTCWQYRPGPDFFPHFRWWGASSFWDIDCRAPAASRDDGFSASFGGREQDIPAFYEIVASVHPVS